MNIFTKLLRTLLWLLPLLRNSMDFRPHLGNLLPPVSSRSWFRGGMTYTPQKHTLIPQHFLLMDWEFGARSGWLLGVGAAFIYRSLSVISFAGYHTGDPA